MAAAAHRTAVITITSRIQAYRKKTREWRHNYVGLIAREFRTPPHPYQIVSTFRKVHCAIVELVYVCINDLNYFWRTYLMSWPSNNGWKDRSWCIVTSKSRFTHARSIVDYQRGYVFVTHYEVLLRFCRGQLKRKNYVMLFQLHVRTFSNDKYAKATLMSKITTRILPPSRKQNLIKNANSPNTSHTQSHFVDKHK